MANGQSSESRRNGARRMSWSNILSASAIVIALSSSVLGNYFSWVRTGSTIEVTIGQHGRDIQGLQQTDKELKDRQERLAEAIAGIHTELAKRNQQIEYSIALMSRVETLLDKNDVRNIETRERLLERMATLEAIVTRWLEQQKRR